MPPRSDVKGTGDALFIPNSRERIQGFSTPAPRTRAEDPYAPEIETYFSLIERREEKKGHAVASAPYLTVAVAPLAVEDSVLDVDVEGNGTELSGFDK